MAERTRGETTAQQREQATPERATEEVPPETALATVGNIGLGRLLAPPPPAGGGAGGDDDNPGNNTSPEASVMTPTLLLSLQRCSGNAATDFVLRSHTRTRVQRTPLNVQRDTKQVSVTGVTVSATRFTIPLEAGLDVKATAQPKDATGVKYTVEKGTVEPSAVTIDEKTGKITVGTQQGGALKAKATADDGSWAERDFQVIEKPTGIASTTTAAGKSDEYGGKFTHTFSAPSGQSSGLHGANVNEKFDSTTAKTPFGSGSFALTANKAGSHGWDLDSSGKMAGPDNVTIGKAGINAGEFVKSASNPSPKTLPAGFTMTQHLHAKSLPSGKLDATPFKDVSHTRTLKDVGSFVVEANTAITDKYEGPPVYSNAAASPAEVVASPPKPKSGSWNQSKSQVTCDVSPSTANKVFAITGKNLGCSVDSSGVVLIGDQAGTITVRVWEGKGPNYDEVKITIKARPPDKAEGKNDMGESGEETDARSPTEMGMPPLEPAAD